jgi:N-acetylmuramoyl-L-alanine amidase
MQHVVKQGECLAKIASKYGFADWRKIYDHPTNEALRKKRPNPHVLFPGDVVFVPDRSAKVITCALGKCHQFRVRSSTKVLRIAVQDRSGKWLSDTPYEIVVEGKAYRGNTDGKGKLELKISVDAEEGTLRVGKYLWPLKIGHLNPIDETPDEGVSGIQARLSNLGYDVGPIDGVLGPRTRAAIRAFQAANPPLAVDGICGPKTRAKLIEKYGS